MFPRHLQQQREWTSRIKARRLWRRRRKRKLWKEKKNLQMKRILRKKNKIKKKRKLANWTMLHMRKGRREVSSIRRAEKDTIRTRRARKDTIRMRRVDKYQSTRYRSNCRMREQNSLK